MAEPELIPAFPYSYEDRSRRHLNIIETVVHRGMTLRDYFAGQYLASQDAICLSKADFEVRSERAYGIADAMLKERSKPCKP